MLLKNKRIKYLKNHSPLDSIIDVYDCDEFTEVTGKAGGDELTYRVYGDSPKNFRITGRQSGDSFMSEAAILEAIHAICDTVIWCIVIGGSIYFLLKIIEEK